MKFNIDCCRYCIAPKRRHLCHGKCEEYKKQIEDRKKIKSMINKEWEIDRQLKLKKERNGKGNK